MPTEVMKRLHEDHRNFRVLMDILEEELDRLGDTDLPEFDLIHEIMRYMVNYADRFHHPLEDLVFARLIKKDASAKGVIEQLEWEHENFAEMGRSILNVLDGNASGETLTWHNVESQCREYMDELVSHKEEEEERIFPLAKAQLTAADWKAIREEIAWREDPVFGPALEQGYRTLYERITRGRE